MELRNYMETLVWNTINNIIDQFGCCTCDRCKVDIAAYALNNLPPKYIVTNEIYAKLQVLESQFEVRITTQVSAGMQRIKENPRH